MEDQVIPFDRANTDHLRTNHYRPDLIASFRAKIDAVLRPVLARSNRVALLGFPTHANVGDSAIWLASLDYLQAAGKTVCYVCDPDTYSRSQLAARLGDGIIVFVGGGNFGDLWKQPHQFRERVIQDFPDTPIVLLPQSVHFESPEALERSRMIFDAHPDITLVLRDRRSLAIARQFFRAPSLLCPDMAFCLGAIQRPTPPTQLFVWLARNDRESTGARLPRTVSTVDWTTEPVSPPIRIERWIRSQVTERPRTALLLQRPLAHAFTLVARHRLRRGCALLGKGRIVVTDRLHAHILSLLLGIPHVVLDNSYGKLRHFYDTWTNPSDLVRWASTPGEAYALATEWAP